MKNIKIDTEYIKLDQFLKFVGIADDGVHAKFLILDELVKVNGETETRRGKKLRVDDIIDFDGEEFIIK